MVKMLKMLLACQQAFNPAFFEMISDTCSCEDDDCKQKVIEKVLMKLQGFVLSFISR